MVLSTVSSLVDQAWVCGTTRTCAWALITAAPPALGQVCKTLLILERQSRHMGQWLGQCTRHAIPTVIFCSDSPSRKEAGATFTAHEVALLRMPEALCTPRLSG